MFRIVWSVFGSVILNQWCVCVRYDGTSYRTHTHRWFKITLPNTDHTIRNMSEWVLILCLLKFLYNVEFNFYVLYNQVHLVG